MTENDLYFCTCALTGEIQQQSQTDSATTGQRTSRVIIQGDVEPFWCAMSFIYNAVVCGPPFLGLVLHAGFELDANLGRYLMQLYTYANHAFASAFAALRCCDHWYDTSLVLMYAMGACQVNWHEQ